jgi:hypothetical protein
MVIFTTYLLKHLYSFPNTTPFQTLLLSKHYSSPNSIFPQMPSKRGKQGLNRALKPNTNANDARPVPRFDNLLEGAEEFFAAGMRYPPEIAIHEELYDIEFHIHFRCWTV